MDGLIYSVLAGWHPGTYWKVSAKNAPPAAARGAYGHSVTFRAVAGLWRQCGTDRRVGQDGPSSLEQDYIAMVIELCPEAARSA